MWFTLKITECPNPSLFSICQSEGFRRTGMGQLIPGLNFIRLILVDTFLLSKNEQDTSQRWCMWHSNLAGIVYSDKHNLVVLSHFLCLSSFMKLGPAYHNAMYSNLIQIQTIWCEVIHIGKENMRRLRAHAGKKCIKGYKYSVVTSEIAYS